MARNFNDMNKENLLSLINSDTEMLMMSSEELKELYHAAKVSGILYGDVEDNLAIAINNRAYKDILKSDQYTAEEKNLAVQTRDEYNDAIRAQKAKRKSNANPAKDYKVGQEKDRGFKKELLKVNQTPAEKKKDLPADLQKSYDFWNKFNENSPKTGIKYEVENVKNRHLLVEAKKGEKTIFKGVDHGSKGFDILKRDKDAEPYEIFDILVKKAKTANPKTVVRIKDNVTDPILRNKILIACAKNNVIPVGNLPEGFDFEALKAAVKEARTSEEINILAAGLYMPADDNEFVMGFSEQEVTPRQAQHSVAQPAQDRDRKIIAPVLLGNHTTTQNAPHTSAPAHNVNSNSGNGGNGNNNISASNTCGANGKAPVAHKRPWWKKVRDFAVIGLLGFLTVKSCDSEKKQDVKDKANTEMFVNKVDSLLKANCDKEAELKLKDGIISDLQRELDDCGKVKPKARPVAKKKVTPIVTPKKTPAKPIVTPKEVKPAVVPEEVKPIVVPKEVKPIVLPEEVKPILEPVEIKPILEPVEVTPIVEPKAKSPNADWPGISLKKQHTGDYEDLDTEDNISGPGLSLKKQHTGSKPSASKAPKTVTRSAADNNENPALSLKKKHTSDEDDLSSADSNNKKGTMSAKEFYQVMMNINSTSK